MLRKNHSGKSLFLSAILVGSLTGGMFSACNLESVPQALFIRGQGILESGCLPPESGSADKVRLKGVLDLSVGRSYDGLLIVENRFPELSAVTSFEEEDARLDGGTVAPRSLKIVHTLPDAVLSDASFQAALTALQVPTPGSEVSVPASGNAIAPTEVGIVQGALIDSSLGQALRSFSGFSQGVSVSVQLEVRATGIRGDGSVVESAPLFYLIELCNNCLVKADVPISVVTQPTPEDLEPDAVFAYGEVCGLGVDVSVSVRYCSQFIAGGTAPDDCRLTRCLGNAQPSLDCPSDGIVLSPTVEDL